MNAPRPRSGRTDQRFAGAQHATGAAEVEGWVRRATKGDTMVYCAAPTLIRGEGSAKVGQLAADGLVRAHQVRRAGGGWEFVIVRTGKAVPVARPQALDRVNQIIFSAFKRAVNLSAPSPTNGDLLELTDLDTIDQVKGRVRMLIQRGLMKSEQVTEDGVTTRVVTIVGDDGVARTSMPPPKHLAALKALRASVDAEKSQ